MEAMLLGEVEEEESDVEDKIERKVTGTPRIMPRKIARKKRPVAAAYE
jgi:hypothetical protein